jgi:hypothetical protein
MAIVVCVSAVVDFVRFATRRHVSAADSCVAAWQR